jgi:hypothetical protein
MCEELGESLYQGDGRTTSLVVIRPLGICAFCKRGKRVKVKGERGNTEPFPPPLIPREDPTFPLLLFPTNAKKAIDTKSL